MSFPTNPADQSTYTDTDGIKYTYYTAGNYWKRTGVSGSGGGVDPTTQQTINDLQVNVIKSNFRIQVLQTASKYAMKNLVIDTYNDTNGMDNTKSSGYTSSGGTLSVKTTNQNDYATDGVQVSSSIGDYTAGITNTGFLAYNSAPGTYSPQNLIDKLHPATFQQSWSQSNSSTWDASVGGSAGATLTLKFPTPMTLVRVVLWMTDTYGSGHSYCDHQIEALNPNTGAWEIVVARVNLASATDKGANTDGSWVYANLNISYNPVQIRIRVWARGSYGTMSEIETFTPGASSAILVSKPDATTVAPTKIILDAEYTVGTGTIKFEISRDGGTTFMQIQPDALTDISSLPTGSSVVSRVTLTGNATITSIGYSWE